MTWDASESLDASARAVVPGWSSEPLLAPLSEPLAVPGGCRRLLGVSYRYRSNEGTWYSCPGHGGHVQRVRSAGAVAVRGSGGGGKLRTEPKSSPVPEPPVASRLLV